LRKTDWLFPQYREIGAFLLRGITPAQMGAVWRGKWHGGLGFTEKCVAPIAIPIGTHGLHAVGAAMGAQRLGEDSVTLAYLGDGATSEGDAHEAAQLRGGVQGTVCVLHPEQPVGHLRPGQPPDGGAVDRAPRGRLWDAGIRVDGNDVLACYAVIAGGRQRAREAAGRR
jgi:pyruvate dehydrogenase E1 component alpha subunit